jgi:hypothetical protein
LEGELEEGTRVEVEKDEGGEELTEGGFGEFERRTYVR